MTVKKYDFLNKILLIVCAILLSLTVTEKVYAEQAATGQATTVQATGQAPADTIPAEAVYVPNELHVGSGCEYATINQAVAAAQPGDTIYVKNGVYNESVKVYKCITIIGESRDGVVLKYPCIDYINPPLEAHCGRFDNLTIKAYGDAFVLDGSHAYAVHCEKSVNYPGSTIVFNNCLFDSRGNFDVGMGSRDGFVATFNNCVFDHYGMFFHSFGNYSKAPTKTNLNLNNCSFNPDSMLAVSNCFSNTNVINANINATRLPKPENVHVVGLLGMEGAVVVDDNFAFSAKNVYWNVK